MVLFHCPLLGGTVGPAGCFAPVASVVDSLMPRYMFTKYFAQHIQLTIFRSNQILTVSLVSNRSIVLTTATGICRCCTRRRTIALIFAEHLNEAPMLSWTRKSAHAKLDRNGALAIVGYEFTVHSRFCRFPHFHIPARLSFSRIV